MASPTSNCVPDPALWTMPTTSIRVQGFALCSPSVASLYFPCHPLLSPHPAARGTLYKSKMDVIPCLQSSNLFPLPLNKIRTPYPPPSRSCILCFFWAPLSSIFCLCSLHFNPTGLLSTHQRGQGHPPAACSMGLSPLDRCMTGSLWLLKHPLQETPLTATSKVHAAIASLLDILSYFLLN